MRHALLIAAGLYTFACLSATPWLPILHGDAAPDPRGQEIPATPPDTTTTPRANVKRTVARTQEDLKDKLPDLKDPENLSSETTYDETTNTYKVGTKLGQSFLEAPFYMTAEEYQEWTMRRSLQAYYRQKNEEEFANSKGKDKFDFTDMKFNLGPAEKIFGPGGVQIKTQGSAELKIGANTRKVDNPSLAERNRKVFGFDFDEQVNLNVTGKVGDKVNLNFNYNTESTFDFDAQSLKLRYEGKEDEIIKLVEAGNVSMPTNSSLIRGASSLFGVRTDLQFGKLKLQAVVSQKKSSSQSVSSKGGVQLTNYEFSADDYEENRHFFLAQYFRDHYDENMRHIPNIMSGININRIEVWVTNKTGTSTNTRNVVAFTDLAESDKISNPIWTGTGGTGLPSNAANNLYTTATTAYAAARDITQTNSVLDGAGLSGGTDYEKLGNARLLSGSEYSINRALGYISLKTTLQPDQVLAVAFEYTYRGQTYQVGELSSNIKDNTQALFVKALKNTANTPDMGNWDLMMKNVYSLGAYSVKKDQFRLNIKYLSDTTGVYLSYLPDPTLKDRKILTLVGLDRLDNNNKTNPNGYFDYVPGYTINDTIGRVYFPMVEPFGEGLRRAIGNDAIADKFIFQELYDSTKTIAKQIAEKNKYTISGQYQASSAGEIQLGASNIPEGSVVVTAGGSILTENVDYTVDYSMGTVKIINQSIIDAGTPVNVSLESNTDYGMVRKTMFGLNWQYDFSKNFQIGGTFMHLGEQPLTTKVAMGSEPLNNTIWGFNLSWKQQSQWLTNLLDKLPLLHCTAPSTINFTGEVAQLIAGKNRGAQGNASYIDDFENTSNDIDISDPREWTLSSCPSFFPESQLTNDVRYGYNRALMAWYNIDPLFTRRSSSLTPAHIKSDLNQLSDPYVREVYKREIYPNKDLNYQEASTMEVLNVAFYPTERGPYNLDPNLNSQGRLSNPQSRWGGMMRRIETSDFQTANIEYIEFWLMDPFIHSRENGTDNSGDLYFNLGEISEDVLKDGKMFYESGLPIDGDPAYYTETIWGRVPNQSTVTYAFNTSSGSRQMQDVGYNGLSSSEEARFSTYQNYLQQIQGRVSQSVYDSIYDNPSGDKYHYFRGSDYDREERSILDRYKYINNPNGNSVDSDHSPESYSTTYKTTPDVDDINQDYTLNEYEKYYQYHVKLSPDRMNVGENFIVDKRTNNVKLRNDSTREITWYLFRIPVDQYESREGNINDFTSVRFMRMFLTNFRNPVVLRFATLNLVRGEWRNYEQALYTGQAPATSGQLSVAAVNFEENTDKTPVNYVIPPGISRVVDPGQSQILQENEQALAMTITDLASGDARAVYKNTSLDLRRYKHLQMFVHANALPEDASLENGQTSLFIRLGSDYKSNFYEYEIPLTLTPEGSYPQSATGAKAVWPEENMLDIDLSELTDIKKNRNKQKALGLTSYGKLYSEYDGDKPNNKISIMGNPTLGEVRTIMIGVRNNSRATKSVEVWANELRLQEFSNSGGWAAQGNLSIQLSDFASLNMSGHLETAGFGGLEESVSQRRQDNLYQYNVTTNVEMGRFFPDKAKVQIPIYYSYSKERTVPKYNPLDSDMEMSDALDALGSDRERDSLRSITDKVVINKNFSISNARVGISTKRHPMPYDPANFSFSYAHSHKQTTGETTVWERDDSWKWSINYNYTPEYESLKPFKNLIKSKSKWLKIFKEQDFNYAPQNVGFNSDITRNYYELKERDLDDLENNSLPLTWASDFLWNRSFTLRWDLTKNLHMSFNSATNAEIEQPYTAVNKDLFPDQYRAWKDSVWNSIKGLGTPLDYQQTFDFSWRPPLNNIPVLDWITADASYNATYNWTRGAELEDGSRPSGNTIASSRTVNANGRFNLEKLYNYVPFLKAANRKYATSASSTTKKKEEKKNFQKEIQLRPDTTTTLSHGQKTKKLRVYAIRQNGQRFPIKYKVLDANNIVILTQDTVKLKVTVVPGPRPEDQFWYKALQFTSRLAMMVRNVSISYRNSYNMSLPGFLPTVGDVFGQRSAGGFQPGLDFAFGFIDDSYIRRAAERGWLVMSDSIVTPATTNLNEDLQIRATLEPIRDLKIDLNASRTTNRARSIQYMYDGMPTQETGSFNMTIISIGTAFKSIGNADNGYESETFNKFVASLEGFRSRVEAQYAGATYPEGTSLAGKPFDPANGTVSPYAPEVMIPAFLSAYAGGGNSLDIFPTLKRLLPNWSVKYSGLAKLPKMKKVFKSFNINHSYKSVYAVGSYNTYSTFMSYMGSIGFIQDVTTGTPTPSSMYDVSTVSINEQFSPLIGVDMTFNNNLTLKAEYRKARVLTLSMTSQQLTETRSNDLVIGCGYKVADLNLFAPRKRARRKQRNKKSDEKTTPQASTGFSNDLNLRFDLTFRDQSAINRDILSVRSQATSGNRAVQASFTADYALSRFLTLSAYYDRQMNRPLLTSSSYPTVTQDFGISLKFMLTR